MKKFKIIVLFLVVSLNASAGNDFVQKGGEGNALGNHSTTIVNAFSIYNNQGAAAFLESTSFGLSYQSSFFPASINDIAITAAAPLSFGTIGGSVEYFGNSLYYEMKVGLAYAMKLGNKVGIGVQLDYLQSKAQNYSGKHFVTFEVGALYEPIESVSVGFHIFNPVKYKVDESTDEILPVVFNVGVQYRPHDQIGIYAEVEKDIDHPFNFKGGLSYQVIDPLAVRAGFSTQPTIFSFGLGYALKEIMLIDVSGNYHLDLGFNTSASVSFLLTKKNAEAE